MSEEEKDKAVEKGIFVPNKLMRAVVGYLASQKYSEVHVIMDGLKKCEVIEKQEE